MLEVVCLSTCLLFTGSMREFGGGGPASANHEDLKEPRVGISTKQDVWRLWGKPAEERKDKVHTIASWNRGKVTENRFDLRRACRLALSRHTRSHLRRHRPRQPDFTRGGGCR